MKFCGNATCHVIIYADTVYDECPGCGMIGDPVPSIGDAIPAMYNKVQRLASNSEHIAEKSTP